MKLYQAILDTVVAICFCIITYYLTGFIVVQNDRARAEIEQIEEDRTITVDTLKCNDLYVKRTHSKVE